MNTSLKENIDDVLLVSDSRRKRKFKATSNRAQMRNRCGTSIVDAQENNENASINVLSENFENAWNSEKDSQKACTKTTDNTGSISEQKNGDSNISNLSAGEAFEECRMSLQDSKWQSFNNDKDSFMDSLDCVIKSNLSVKKNITGSKNSLLNCDFSQGNKDPKHSTIKISRGLKTEHISPEMTSEDSNHIDKMAANEKESICSIKDDIEVAGPSRIRPLKKMFVCDICSKEFKWKRSLQEHYRIHTGERPFECRICKTSFARKSSLKQHYKIHSDEKAFVCDMCGKDFNFKQNLQIHYRTHTGEKPFVCNVCQKAFAQVSTLQTHIRTHTGVKPYKCPICGMTFAHINNCNRHLRKLHE
ncbi:zinc finger protein 33B-like [Argiope bruennichi]|uniref:zinc finger protein 33B-like n=1 Tax=Argiope bruennichi TaxID=94029 RepID=UPI002494A3CB|nr:zinc finger protein 33B-like [Argiope bruennichi]